MVQKDSNAVRLAALKIRKNDKNKQTTLIKKSLVDSSVNKVTKFSDSESSDNNNKISDILHDVDETVQDDLFAEKSQFLGKKGVKLMQLQSKIGADERFKLDHRFETDSDDESSESDQDSEELELMQEKETQHGIMDSVLESLGLRSRRQVEQRFQIVDDFVRFDPTNTDHDKFLVKSCETTDIPKKPTKTDDIQTESAKQESTQDVPQVDDKTYFEINADFNTAITSNGSGGFTFGFNVDCFKDESKNETGKVESLEIKELQYDSSDDEGPFISNNIPSEQTSNTRKQSPFFYTLNPIFRSNSCHSFKRSKTMDEIEQDWLSKRQQLTIEYKKRHKDAIRFQRKLSTKS